jgi:hypothetical protein
MKRLDEVVTITKGELFRLKNDWDEEEFEKVLKFLREFRRTIEKSPELTEAFGELPFTQGNPFEIRDKAWQILVENMCGEYTAEAGDL